jgi:amidohydrolase
MPHEGDDPIVRAARLIQDVQAIASRRVDPFAPAVISLTAIHGGDAFNVIPDRVELRGTVRTFAPAVRDEIHARLAEAVGETGTLEIRAVTRPLVNHPRMCALVREAAAGVVNEENIVDDLRTPGGEDFASVVAEVPGCFFFVGSAPAAGAEPHHSPRFDIDERALPLGLEILSRAVALWGERGLS